MHCQGNMTRGALLRRGAGAGSLLALGGVGAAVLAGPAVALALPDGDLAYLRLLAAAELLALDYQGQALSGGKLSGDASAIVTQALADDKAHYAGLVDLLGKGNVVAATADDIDFAYPKGSFDSEASILKLANTVEQLTLGAYTGALENLQTPLIRLPVAQIAANEAQHVAALAALGGKPVIGKAFGPALSIDAVTTALDEYES
jgi:Ferritin-like domain